MKLLFAFQGASVSKRLGGHCVRTGVSALICLPESHPLPIAMAEVEAVISEDRGAVKKRLVRIVDQMSVPELMAWEEKGKDILKAREGDPPRRRPTNPDGSRNPCLL
jgi:hypothetical protein